MNSEEELRRGVIYLKENFNEKEIEYFKNSLLNYIVDLINYYKNDNELSEKDKLDALAFGILTALDGNGDGGYYMIPITEGHFYDPEYYIPDETISKYDIGGSLHEGLYSIINEKIKI